MTDYVQIVPTLNWAWGWPNDFSRALSHRFGEGGWCAGCGRALGPQAGSLTLGRAGKRMPTVWSPNWWHDVWCLSAEFADVLKADVPELELTPVAWKGRDPGGAYQVRSVELEQPLLDPAELSAVLEEHHGTAGTHCRVCGEWRWLPLITGRSLMQIIPGSHGGESRPVLATSERFGDGWKDMRVILWREDLAKRVLEAETTLIERSRIAL